MPGKGSFVGVIANQKTPKKTGVPRAIGLIISDFNDAFGTGLLKSIEEHCTDMGYRLILKNSHDSVGDEEQALKSLNSEEIAGIMVLPVHGEYYNSEILKKILNKKPLVFVDRKMKGLPVPSVSTDNTAAARTGVEYLLRQGHRNIAFYSAPIEFASTLEDRRNGFIDAFANNGITFDPASFCLNLSFSEGTEAIKRHLGEHPEITAAFVAEFSMSLIVRDAVQEMGLSIPEDFSLVTVDFPDHIPDMPLLTHLKQDEIEIGRKAVESLQNIIAGIDPVSIGDIRIPARLVTGSSSAPVKKRFNKPQKAAQRV
jgi:DNA-binding LacI/PurR family transcriptional regulator